MPKRNPISPGTSFSRLTVLQEQIRSHGKSRRSQCECVCSCGRIKWFDSQSLLLGLTKSCGCIRAETTAKRCTKHGQSKRSVRSPAYRSWADMIQRCTNRNNAVYKNYGGRGITITPSWFDFVNFVADMGVPARGMTIERIDVDGCYEKSNCCWIPRPEQPKNRRDSIRISVDEDSVCLAEACRIYGIRYGLAYYRITHGWPMENIFRQRSKRHP